MGDFAAAAAGRAAMSAAERQQAAREKHTQSLRAVAESLSVARETAHTLSMQSGALSVYVCMCLYCSAGAMTGWLVW